MAMRKVTLQVRDTQSSFTESYTEGERSAFQVGATQDEIERWAYDLIQHYNGTLRPGERPRTLEGVTVEETTQENPTDHDWHKTNLVTVLDHRGAYDRLECSRCHITAKRFGLAHVKIDPRYGAAGYRTCEGAVKLLARRRVKETPGE